MASRLNKILRHIVVSTFVILLLPFNVYSATRTPLQIQMDTIANAAARLVVYEKRMWKNTNIDLSESKGLLKLSQILQRNGLINEVTIDNETGIITISLREESFVNEFLRGSQIVLTPQYRNEEYQLVTYEERTEVVEQSRDEETKAFSQGEIPIESYRCTFSNGADTAKEKNIFKYAIRRSTVITEGRNGQPLDNILKTYCQKTN